MRSTRASAAWAAMALATSLLSVAIVSVQPHSGATATSVAVSSDNVLRALEPMDVVERASRIEARRSGEPRPEPTERDAR